MDHQGKSSKALVGIRVARYGVILSERDGFACVKWDGIGGGETVEWLADLTELEDKNEEVPEVRRTWWANLLSKMSP